MTVIFDKTMNPPSAEKFARRDPFYNFPPKFYQQEYIASVNKPKSRKTTFQAAMKLTVIIGQFFGINPVLGVCETDVSKLRFTYFSGRCLYSIFSIALQVILFVASVIKSFNEPQSKLTDNTFVVFYGTNTVTTIMFLRLATQWPKLCNRIARVEATDPNVHDDLIRRCNIASALVLTLALLEHILSDLSGVVIAKDCQPNTNWYEAFCLQSFSWLWTSVPYNNFYGSVALFINLQLTFTWNFGDAFVICIGIYLTARLEQINDRLNAVRGKFVPSTFWRAMREDYTRATSLVRKVDDVISGIIFIAFVNNLFFICLQLLNTLDEGIKARPACGMSLDSRPLKGYEQTVYFVYSFLFLLGRSLAVSLVAARVNTASQKPAQALYDVPSAAYCVEVQRFLSQVHGDTVALTGLKFFSVKKGMVLTVAGTIVTYELVLMQFAGVTPTVAPVTTVASNIFVQTSPMFSITSSLVNSTVG